MKPPVVIESGDGGSINWYGTARSLGIHKVPVIRLSSRKWYPSKYCRTVPCPDINANPQRYLHFLMKMGQQLYLKNHVKPLLFTSSDDGLSIISQHKEELARYFEPVCMDWQYTERIIDKKKTYQFAKTLGMAVPETHIPNNSEEVESIAESIDYPCLLKPAQSHIFTQQFGVKMLQIDTPNNLMKSWNALSQQGHQLLIQEAIPGADDLLYTLGTCFSKKHLPLAVFTGQKLRQYPPQYGIASVSKSVWKPEVADLGIRLLTNLQFYGIAQVEFKLDVRTDEFKLLEVNGRSWTWNYLATICGVNLPYILYKDILGHNHDPPLSYTCHFIEEIKWIHLRLDIPSLIMNYKMGNIKLSSWLQQLVTGKKHFAYINWDDTRPCLSELRRMLNLVNAYKRIRS